MISFATIYSLPAHEPIRLQPILAGEDRFMVSADLTLKILEARSFLSSDLSKLPLRLPVSPQSLITFSEREDLVASLLSGAEFGLTTWSSDWAECSQVNAWSRLTQAGASFTLLELGVAHSSVAMLAFYPIRSVEIGAHIVEASNEATESEPNPVLASLCKVAASMGVVACARLQSSASPPDFFARYGVSEYVHVSRGGTTH